MTRPLDRECLLPELGDLDRERGEFWVPNPFMMPQAGHNLSAHERNRLFLNVAGTGFIDASRFSAADIDSDSRSVVAADFDRDGQTDLLVASVGGGPLRLFLNRFSVPGNRRVLLDLVGTASNRPAIGARIELECGGRRIVRDRFAPNGFMGMGPPELLVGVGAAERIDRLTVRWPTGRTQEFTDLPVDVRLTITEGAETVESAGLPPARAK
ncbi:MAG TPA: CRTAC1 family protein [Planctomycetaceae bacterium]|nr:CRTAC1 family protein [Planctomycetaceae bacterium]